MVVPHELGHQCYPSESHPCVKNTLLRHFVKLKRKFITENKRKQTNYFLDQLEEKIII